MNDPLRWLVQTMRALDKAAARYSTFDAGRVADDTERQWQAQSTTRTR